MVDIARWSGPDLLWLYALCDFKPEIIKMRTKWGPKNSIGSPRIGTSGNVVNILVYIQFLDAIASPSTFPCWRTPLRGLRPEVRRASNQKFFVYYNGKRESIALYALKGNVSLTLVKDEPTNKTLLRRRMHFFYQNTFAYNKLKKK